ncbi:MAG: helix-turn-helix transcriptional regulator [Gemmatimonadota bacterium]
MDEATKSVTEGRLIDEEEAAELLGVSRTWLQRKRLGGIGPRHLRIGVAIRYVPVEVLTWAQENFTVEAED